MLSPRLSHEAKILDKPLPLMFIGAVAWLVRVLAPAGVALEFPTAPWSGDGPSTAGPSLEHNFMNGDEPSPLRPGGSYTFHWTRIRSLFFARSSPIEPD